MNKQLLTRLFAAVSICAAFILLLIPMTAAQAQTPAVTAEKLVNIDVVGADFHTVVMELERETGTNILVRDGDKPYKPVTIHLVNASLSKALRRIALSAGAVLTQDYSGTYNFASENSSVPAPESAAPVALSSARALINPADLRWYKITLRYADANYTMTLMHWDKAKSKVVPAEPDLAQVPMGNGFFRTRPFQNDPSLPEGVAAVIAWTGPNALLIQATPEGFEQIRQIVKILDVARFGWTMKVTCWTAFVSNREASKLTFVRRNYPDQMIEKPVEIAVGTPVKTLLEALIAASQAESVPVKYEAEHIQEWQLPGFRLTNTRIRSDDSISVGLEGIDYHWEQQLPMTAANKDPSDILPRLILYKGDVLALRSSDPSAKGQITFIKVDY